MPDLVLKNIKKKYPSFTLDVDLEVRQGEFLSIIGPSGSGKSTLLNIIAGLESPDSGKVLFADEDLTDVSVQKRGFSMVFQDYALFPSMNVEKNLSYAMRIRKMKRGEQKENIKALLCFVNLSGYEKRRIQTLSGGEAQRVALARALSSQPRVLLLDEPLSALDASLRRHLRDEIRRIHDERGNLTTIYVTHDREEAFSISDRIAIIRNGRIEMVDTCENIYRQPKTLFTAYFTGDGTGLPAELFSLELDADTIFFRPEAVRVPADGLFYGDSDAYIILENTEVVSAEFLGRNYLLGLSWQGHRLLAESFSRPQSRTITVYIRKTQLLFFRDNELVT